MPDKQPKLGTLVPYAIICSLILIGGLSVSIFSYLIWGGRDAWGWFVSTLVVNTVVMIVGVMNAFGAFDD